MRALILAILAGIMIASPVAAQTDLKTSLDAPPAWAPGDSWTWRGPMGNGTLKYTVLGATGDGYSVQVRSKSDMSVIRVNQDLVPQGAVTFLLHWPLKPGSTWSVEITGHAANGIYGTSNQWTTTLTVMGQESISVPAGTFEAVRIDAHECNETQHGRCGDFTLWYAPAVKYIVKVKWGAEAYWSDPVRGGTEELLSTTVAH